MRGSVFLLLKKAASRAPDMLDAETWALEVVKRFASKNLDGLLDLFDDDAILYEPFSTQEILNGLSEITPFLKVVCDNPRFLFNEKSAKVSEIKYIRADFPRVNLRIKGPTNYRLEFEFREVLIEELRKRVGKVKKLRIDVED